MLLLWILILSIEVTLLGSTSINNYKDCLYPCYDGYVIALFSAINDRIYNHSSLILTCTHNYNETIRLLEEKLATTYTLYYNKDDPTDNALTLKSTEYIPFTIGASILGAFVLIAIILVIAICTTFKKAGAFCLSG